MSKQTSSGLSAGQRPGSAFFVVFCISSIAYSQTAGTASIQGTVSDPPAPPANASVILTNTDTHRRPSTVTDSAGLYSLPSVSVGPYSLAVTASGLAASPRTESSRSATTSDQPNA